MIVGHFTFICLARRPTLSICQALYAFIEQYGRKHARIWDAVKCELRWAVALLPLMCRNLVAPWSSTVVTSDASTYGRGVCLPRAAADLRGIGC